MGGGKIWRTDGFSGSKVARSICENDRIGCKLGWCQGPLTYGDEKSRMEAWQQLVTKAMVNLKEQPIEIT